MLECFIEFILYSFYLRTTGTNWKKYINLIFCCYKLVVFFYGISGKCQSWLLLLHKYIEIILTSYRNTFIYYL